MQPKFILFVLLLVLPLIAGAQDFQTDTLKTDKGPLLITFIGHGTLYFEYDGKVVHADPWSRLADYSQLPKADLILITHEHGDHLDPDAVEALKKDNTKTVITQTCANRVDGLVMKNGDEKEINGFTVKAVPAYNIKHMRSGDNPFHPMGVGNGYVITFGDKNVYVAGDTENIPEMKNLNGKIDVAFLPMNLPYTMSPEMAADAAKMVSPKILYPYHFGDTDVQQIVTLLQDTEIDVRIRDMK